MLENHYLVKNPNFTYEDIACDPAIVGNQPPVAITTSDIYDDNVGVLVGYMPHSQWYRAQPPTVHHNYKALEGYPFLDAAYSSAALGQGIQSADFDSMFQTTQLGHWNIQARNNVTVHRSIPSARDSLLTN